MFYVLSKIVFIYVYVIFESVLSSLISVKCGRHIRCTG
jgi:hypothetical protein